MINVINFVIYRIDFYSYAMTHIFTSLCSSNLQEFNTILKNFGIKIKQFLNVFFLKILSIKTINVQNFVIHRKGFSS